jgi:hypothetical protein
MPWANRASRASGRSSAMVYRQRRRDRAGNRCQDLHAPARYPHGREWRPFSAYAGGTWSVAASDVQAVLPSRRATGAGCHRPAFDRWGNTAHRWRHRRYLYSWALRGQVALLWRPGRMLFAGDVCMNVMGLGDPVGFESLTEGRASQRKLASLSFDAAGFGHGAPIARDASTRFRNKWGKKSAA